jgi:hypothetical protein
LKKKSAPQNFSIYQILKLKIEDFKKMLSMVSHTFKLVILGGKLTSVKKIIAGGQTTVHVDKFVERNNLERHILLKEAQKDQMFVSVEKIIILIM